MFIQKKDVKNKQCSIIFIIGYIQFGFGDLDIINSNLVRNSVKVKLVVFILGKFFIFLNIIYVINDKKVIIVEIIFKIKFKQFFVIIVFWNFIV